MLVFYANDRVRRVSKGILTFIVQGIRYRLPLLTLCDIYGFQNRDRSRCIVPPFLRQSVLWGHLASGYFNSGTATQTDIRHPTLHYFLKVLANTLLCKMEPKKIRVQELKMLYYTVRSLVPFGEIVEPVHDLWPNLGAVFAEHLMKLKMKPIGGRRLKKERVGSLLTLTFMHLGIPLAEATVIRTQAYMDAEHLTYAQWMKDDCFWSFGDGTRIYLLELPQRYVTDLQSDLTQFEFHPDPLLPRNPANIPHRRPMPRAARAAERSQPVVPDFPHIPDISMQDHGDFQRIVVDSLHAIWAKVSQCRCFSRGSMRAKSPSAAGPPGKPNDESDEDTEED